MYSPLSDIDLNKSAEGGSSETVDIDSDGEGFDLVHEITRTNASIQGVLICPLQGSR